MKELLSRRLIAGTAALLLNTLSSCKTETSMSIAQDRKPDPAIRIRVGTNVLNAVDDRLFGQFMERASWGEPGFDAARVGDSGKLRPQVVELIREMRAPVIRYPGGTDMAHIDWRDMIDNVPGRQGGRPPFKVGDRPPLTNAFGIDEFIALCREVGSEPLLVCDLEAAFARRVPLADAARNWAGLVAYCNAPLGARLPEGMPDWPAVRARNGHPEPYRVRYFQIGNEWDTYFDRDIKQIGMEDKPAADKAAWVLACVHAYVKAMKAVDPAIQLLFDSYAGGGEPISRILLADPTFMDAPAFHVAHMYQPWTISEVKKGTETVPIGSLSAEDVWYAWTATPGIDPATGEASLQAWRDAAFQVPTCKKEKWRFAITEWNWNGWWGLPAGQTPPIKADLAKGLGAAGYLHAFMRSGDLFQMACQSMLVGSRWGIAAIRVDARNAVAPYLRPTGQATALYSRYHGNERLEVQTAGIPVRPQPYRMGGIAECGKLALLDIVATRGKQAIFLHVINRCFDLDLEARIDLSGQARLAGRAILHTLTGRLEAEPAAGEPRGVATVMDREIVFTDTALTTGFPKRSVSVLEFPFSPLPAADTRRTPR